MSSNSPCPRLQDLDTALRALSWSEVKRMAIHLHHTLTLPLLDKISEDRSTAEERCLYCMRQWLDSDVDACWPKVVSALRVIEKHQLAKELESRYCAVSVGAASRACIELADASVSPRESQARPQSLQMPGDTASSSEATPSPVVEPFVLRNVDELERVVKGFLDLEEQFVSLVTHVQFYFSEKESVSPKFLGMFRLTLINLPMSRKFKHMHFLGEKKQLISAAQDIGDIFNILSPYWNHVDYSLLEHITMEFGSRDMKKRVKVYITSLIKFEKVTTIQIFIDATCDDRKIPPEFNEVIIKLDRKPSECTLYDIRKFKESLACRSSLSAYSVQLKRVGVGSVVVVLAVPGEVVDMFLKAAEDYQFKIGSCILSVERASVVAIQPAVLECKLRADRSPVLDAPTTDVPSSLTFSDPSNKNEDSTGRPVLQRQFGVPLGSPTMEVRTKLLSSTLDSPTISITSSCSTPPSPTVSSWGSSDEEEEKTHELSSTTPADQLDGKKPRPLPRYTYSQPPPSQISYASNVFDSPTYGPERLSEACVTTATGSTEIPEPSMLLQSPLVELKNQILKDSSGSMFSILSVDSGFSSCSSLASYLSSSKLSLFSSDSVVYGDHTSEHHHSAQKPRPYNQPHMNPQSPDTQEPVLRTLGEGEADIIDKILLEAVNCLMHQENCQIPNCPCKQVKKRFKHILPQMKEVQSGNFNPTDRRQHSPAVTPSGEKIRVLSPTTPSSSSIAPPVLLREISLSADNLPSLCLNDCPMAATPLMQLSNRPLGSAVKSPLSTTQHDEVTYSSSSSDKEQTSKRFTRSNSCSSLRTTSTHKSGESSATQSSSDSEYSTVTDGESSHGHSSSVHTVGKRTLRHRPSYLHLQRTNEPMHSRQKKEISVDPSIKRTSTGTRVSHLTTASETAVVSQESDSSITTETLC